MRHPKSTAVAILAAAALAVIAPAAHADAPPYADSTGCQGLIIGQLNHDGGAYGPSENPKASQGPGPYFGNETIGAIERVRDVYCP